MRAEAKVLRRPVSDAVTVFRIDPVGPYLFRLHTFDPAREISLVDRAGLTSYLRKIFK